MASVEVTRPSTTQQLVDDSGFASRKFLGFIYGSALISLLAVASCWAKLILLKDSLGEVVGGVVGLYGLYVGGNVVTKWGAGKHAAAAKAPAAKKT